MAPPPTPNEIVAAIQALPPQQREVALRHLHSAQLADALSVIGHAKPEDQAAAAARFKTARDMSPEEFKRAKRKIEDDAHAADRRARDARDLAALHRKYPQRTPTQPVTKG